MPLARKNLRNTQVSVEDGFTGTAAVNGTLSASDTTVDVDTLAGLPDAATIVPVGARFTTAGYTTIRTVTASNNSQRWSLTIDATGGTYTLTLNGETTANIAYDANAATIQAALEALASVTAGDVVVAGAGPYTITMAGNLKNVATNTLTSTATGLTGGGSTATLAVVHAGTTTWNVTFSPAIAAGSVPADNDVITWLGQRVTAKVGEGGDADWTENSEITIHLNTGKIDQAGLGDEQAVDVNVTLAFEQLVASSGEAVTFYEALHRINGAAGWYNAAPNPCEPYCVKLVIEDIPPCNSVDGEVITFPRFYKNSINPSISNAQISLSGQSLAIRPTIERKSKAAILGT